MKKQWIWVLVCLMMILAACGKETVTVATTAPAEVPETAQEEVTTVGILSAFSTVDLEGNAVDQSVLKNAPLTMVNAWATYCGPCIQEMPDLGELAKEYADKGVQIIGLVTDVLDYDGSISQQQIDAAKDIVAATNANYLHLVPSEDLYGVLAQITAVPTTFFVDEEGKLVGNAYMGSRSKADWSAILDETLAEVF